MTEHRVIIVAITGASGAAYGVKALELLHAEHNVTTHLVVTSDGLRTAKLETGLGLDGLKSRADVFHSDRNTGAAIASGSFPTDGMLIAPCSIKTLSSIANSYDENLVSRAADVCLKERRKLVLMVRETPLHAGHIQLMAQADRNGAIVMPPVPEFYSKPQSLDDMVTQTTCRALAILGVVPQSMKQWLDSP
jgi:4-hydroxy-3-polyprenylbenzoate decarboxylase